MNDDILAMMWVLKYLILWLSDVFFRIGKEAGVGRN